MEFAYVNTAITIDVRRAAIKKHARVILELGIRKDNEHVGSGLGGNNFQLLTLMGMKHSLVRGGSIRVSEDNIWWDAEWLVKAKRRDIRSRLDMVFPKIKERYKLMPLALDGAHNLRSYLTQNADQFPALSKALTTCVQYRFDPKLSLLDKYLLACVMCQEMSARLDKGDTSLVHSVGQAIAKMPNEIILLSVRRHVQIERLVRHDLDEDPVWWPFLNRVNKDVD